MNNYRLSDENEEQICILSITLHDWLSLGEEMIQDYSSKLSSRLYKGILITSSIQMFLCEI